MEVITRVERRRRWATAEKLRLVAATREPGATVASVAREHSISEGLLYTWRSRLGRGPAVASFAPLTLLDEPRADPTAGARLGRDRREAGQAGVRPRRLGRPPAPSVER
jgi:transposase